MLLVEAPDRYVPERRYILDLVLEEWLCLEYELIVRDRTDTQIRRVGDDSPRSLVVSDLLFGTPDDRWLTADSLPTAPLRWLDGSRADDPVPGPARDMPILFGFPRPDGRAVVVDEDTVHLTIDVFGSAFFCVTRYEELVDPTRDRHGRFPAAASLAAREGFLDRPLVDEYVRLLSGAMRLLWPDLPERQAPFHLRLTHDVDHPWSSLGQPWRRVAQALAADIVKRHDPQLAGRRVLAMADARRSRVDRDPLNRFDLFMDVAERNDLRATFFFQAGTRPGDPDFRYRVSDRQFAPLLRRIHERGHEIGYHGSYASHRSPGRTATELADLHDALQAAGIDQRLVSARQHFLRFDASTTWQVLDAAGVAYDWTLGYADRAGFRAGTCREFPVFDLRQRRPLALRERPLLAMDTTLVEYEGLTIEGIEARVMSLVAECRAEGGGAVLLYHNNTLPGRQFERHYSRLVDDLARS